MRFIIAGFIALATAALICACARCDFRAGLGPYVSLNVETTAPLSALKGE